MYETGPYETDPVPLHNASRRSARPRQILYLNPTLCLQQMAIIPNLAQPHIPTHLPTGCLSAPLAVIL